MGITVWIRRFLLSGICTLSICAVVAVFLSCSTASAAPSAEEMQRALDAHTGFMESLEILNPLDQAAYPPDFAPPLVAWEPSGFAQEHWLVRVELKDRSVLAASGQPFWRMDQDTWDAVRALAVKQPVRIHVTSFDGDRPAALGETRLSVAPDPFDARVLVQRIPVPFLHAQDNPGLSRWLLDDPTTLEPPVTVLSEMPHCGNCHTVSGNGKVFGMDIDLHGDKGGYALTDMDRDLRLGPDQFISWSRYKPDQPRRSMGLFTKLSTDGRFAVTTVKEKSFFIPIDHVTYSQLFFPIRGHLAYYDRQTGTMAALPGADREDRVQTSPALSPDGKWLVFAGAPLNQELLDAIGDRKFLPANGRYIDELNDLYPYQFDLYRMPFDQGRGGEPQPLAGASANGMSNYFPRYSPDGRWVVYCRAPTGLVQQPDSELWIVPAQGGQARRLACNTEPFNSWHSFTPNGRWIVFSAKQVSVFTQIYAAHLDEQGRASRPVLLDALAEHGAAFIIPEAVPADIPLRSIRIDVPAPDATS